MTCPQPGTSQAVEDALLARPGVMRALWWSVCRGCESRIEAGEVVGLADTATGRAWVCRRCLAPELDADVPAPRAAETAGVPS